MGSSSAPLPEETACPEKTRLLYRYNSLLAEYSRTVTFLYSRIGVLRKDAYREISEFTEAARVRSEEAREALDSHVREHGC